ncbi:hypothetical protein IGI66_003735 [Enterococcus sp. AZ048]|uniref:LssY C-terminal domain-containing protein n=1 Tax=Enterococcus sp. AZ048 TaxID=2774658 RepID=UPI003F25B85F
MLRQKVLNFIFRTIRFMFISILGLLIYQTLLTDILTKGYHIVAYIIFWLFSSYIILPIFNKFVSKQYLPNYFIGRARTTDGLLGDPINLAFIGSEEDIKKLFLEVRWTLADPISLKSSIRITFSSIMKKSYPNAPVSSLFLFNQKQSFALEKEISGNPRERHHIRFWKTPKNWYLPGGFQTDWLAAATYDKKVGLSLFTGQLTHKISSNIDKERDFVIQTLSKNHQQLTVKTVKNFTSSYHGRNGGGDHIYTDGSLPFIDLTK